MDGDIFKTKLDEARTSGKSVESEKELAAKTGADDVKEEPKTSVSQHSEFFLKSLFSLFSKLLLYC